MKLISRLSEIGRIDLGLYWVDFFEIRLHQIFYVPDFENFYPYEHLANEQVIGVNKYETAKAFNLKSKPRFYQRVCRLARYKLIGLPRCRVWGGSWEEYKGFHCTKTILSFLNHHRPIAVLLEDLAFHHSEALKSIFQNHQHHLTDLKSINFGST